MKHLQGDTPSNYIVQSPNDPAPPAGGGLEFIPNEPIPAANEWNQHQPQQTQQQNVVSDKRYLPSNSVVISSSNPANEIMVQQEQYSYNLGGTGRRPSITSKGGIGNTYIQQVPHVPASLPGSPPSGRHKLQRQSSGGGSVKTKADHWVQQNSTSANALVKKGAPWPVLRGARTKTLAAAREEGIVVDSETMTPIQQQSHQLPLQTTMPGSMENIQAVLQNPVYSQSGAAKRPSQGAISALANGSSSDSGRGKAPQMAISRVMMQVYPNGGPSQPALQQHHVPQLQTQQLQQQQQPPTSGFQGQHQVQTSAVHRQEPAQLQQAQGQFGQVHQQQPAMQNQLIHYPQQSMGQQNRGAPSMQYQQPPVQNVQQLQQQPLIQNVQHQHQPSTAGHNRQQQIQYPQMQQQPSMQNQNSAPPQTQQQSQPQLQKMQTMQPPSVQNNKALPQANMQPQQQQQQLTKQPQSQYLQQQNLTHQQPLQGLQQNQPPLQYQQPPPQQAMHYQPSQASQVMQHQPSQAPQVMQHQPSQAPQVLQHQQHQKTQAQPHHQIQQSAQPLHQQHPHQPQQHQPNLTHRPLHLAISQPPPAQSHQPAVNQPLSIQPPSPSAPWAKKEWKSVQSPRSEDQPSSFPPPTAAVRPPQHHHQDDGTGSEAFATPPTSPAKKQAPLASWSQQQQQPAVGPESPVGQFRRKSTPGPGGPIFQNWKPPTPTGSTPTTPQQEQQPKPSLPPPQQQQTPQKGKTPPPVLPKPKLQLVQGQGRQTGQQSQGQVQTQPPWKRGANWPPTKPPPDFTTNSEEESKNWTLAKQQQNELKNRLEHTLVARQPGGGGRESEIKRGGNEEGEEIAGAGWAPLGRCLSPADVGSAENGEHLLKPSMIKAQQPKYTPEQLKAMDMTVPKAIKSISTAELLAQYQAAWDDADAPVVPEVVRCGLPEHKRPSEADNDTDVEKCIQRIKDNDPSLVEVNLNNMKRTPIPQLQRLIAALKENTNLKKLSLANLGLFDNAMEVLLEALETNTSIEVLNIETNFLTGNYLVRLFQSALVQQTLREVKAVNQSATFSNAQEQEMMKAIYKNRALVKVSLNLRLTETRARVEKALIRNGEMRRLQRKLEAEGCDFQEYMKNLSKQEDESLQA